MSVVKNKETRFHETPQDVRFKLSRLTIDNINDIPALFITGRLTGKVGSAEGVVDTKNADMSIDDIREHFSPAEKQAARAFIAACERVLSLNDPELTGEAHDGSDVFIDPEA